MRARARERERERERPTVQHGPTIVSTALFKLSQPCASHHVPCRQSRSSPINRLIVVVSLSPSRGPQQGPQER